MPGRRKKGALPEELTKIKKLTGRALDDTASYWPAIASLYFFIHRAAQILANREEQDSGAVKRRFAGLLGAMSRRREQFGELSGAADHFLEITQHYWANLFFCYDIPDLPRTNNDLEQAFGSFRHAQRRATGRKKAMRGEVLHGQASIVACLGTKARVYTAVDLATVDTAAWKALRSKIAKRQDHRTLGLRFRKDSAAYLRTLSERLLNLPLPL